MRVPKELRPLYETENLRRSLKTSERSEAISRLRYELCKVEAEFAEKRRQLFATRR